MAQISKYVRDAIKTQLAANTTGFNARLAAISSTYGITAAQIDWTATSTNFIFGRMAPELFEESSVFTYPLLTIDTIRSQDMRRVKFSTFSGSVAAVIDVHHSWPDESVIADFASVVDATEDAVVACLNDKATQVWPGNLLWNGQVQVQRGPIKMGGYGWVLTLSFLCNFELVA